MREKALQQKNLGRLRTGLAVIPVLFLIPSISADYTIGIYQVQPLQPEPGDTVVFKVTVANEPRWSRVLSARVISPDGRVFELASIRYVDRAGSDIVHSEHVSWKVPKDALEGNYTLEVSTPENVFLKTTFWVFRFPKIIYSEGLIKNVGYSTAREVEVRASPCDKCSSTFYKYLGELEAGQSKQVELRKGNSTKLEVSYRYDKIYSSSFPITKERAALSIHTAYENGTFSVFADSNSEIEILREIPVKVKQTQTDFEIRFLPVKFKVLRQNVLSGRAATFQILPEADFIEIPVRVRTEEEEKLVIWSGQVPQKAAETPETKLQQSSFDYRSAFIFVLIALTALLCRKYAHAS